MTLWDVRQYIESHLPWWSFLVPMGIYAAYALYIGMKLKLFRKPK